MKSVDKAIQSLIPGGNLLSNMFEGLGNIVSGIARSGLRILEYALGSLVASAVRTVTRELRELISATIEAGQTFQVLNLRLERLNYNDLINSGMDYVQAGKEAIDITREQMTWLQRLAVQTPYDADDVANVFTLARSYNFAGDAAQGLTQDILNFASGMGLSNEHLQRIIVNFGQLQQQGKINARELTDLARGAFVPVNDILAQMEKNTGKAYSELKSTPEGVQEFFKAFSDIVNQRFVGATEAMSRTLGAATDNARDLVQSLVGMNILKPVFDTLGGAIADIIDAIAGRWDEVVGIAKSVGYSLSVIISDVMGMAPSTESLAEGLISGFRNFAIWLASNRDKIVGFFQTIADTIRTQVIPFITGKLIPAIGKFFDWINQNKGNATSLFQEIGEVISTEIIPFIVNDLIPALSGMFSFLLENRGVFVEVFQTVAEAITGIAPVLINEFIPAIQSAISWLNEHRGVVEAAVIGFLAFQIALGAVTLMFSSVVGAIIVFVTYMVAMVSQAIEFSSFLWTSIVSIFTRGGSTLVTVTYASFGAILTGIINFAAQAISIIRETVGDIALQFKARDWAKIGSDIMEGIIRGIKRMISAAIQAAREAAAAIAAALSGALGIQSPSKVTMEFGEQTMKGFALGIQKATGMVVQTMANAVGNIAAPAMQMPASVQSFASAAPGVATNYNTTNNYNLAINTGANTEPIVQDFSLMQSLAGY